MQQLQGNKTTNGGRLDGSVQQNSVTNAKFALGAGWGTTASIAVDAGSTDQRGYVTVTSAGTGQAQATATVTFTFADGAYASKPYALVQLVDNDNAVTTAQPQGVLASTTALAWTAAVLPVATKIYKFAYVVIA